MIYAMLVHKRDEAIDEYARLRRRHRPSKTYFEHLMKLTNQQLYKETRGLWFWTTTWIRVARKGSQWGRRHHAKRGG